MSESSLLDLLIIGAGPTGIAVGAQAKREGLDVLVVDKGPLTSSLQAYPTDLVFFTTRERLEIADVPFAIPDVKPNRRQALVYYREVVRRHQVPLALYERVETVRRAEGDVTKRGAADGRIFEVHSVKDGVARMRRARAVVLATGYFWNPKRLGVPGEDLPWVRTQYREPYPHFDQEVVLVGAGNSSIKTALDLWRNGARVTVVHRRSEIKPTVKYWLKPDFLNRVEEGAIRIYYESRVEAFRPAAADRRSAVEIATPEGPVSLPADAAYVLIGYLPDVELMRRCGIEVDDETAEPTFDPESYESNVPGLYLAGTVQAGRNTGRIFIENSRDHGEKIVRHFLARRAPQEKR